MERIKRNADRQEYLRDAGRPFEAEIGGQVIERVDEKIKIFEVSQDSEIDDDADRDR